MVGYVYIMTAGLWSYKIGVSKHPRTRAKQVSRDVRKVRILVAVPTLFPYQLERLLHIVFGNGRTRLEGNGGTEFFIDFLGVGQIVASIILVLIVCIYVAIFLGIFFSLI